MRIAVLFDPSPARKKTAVVLLSTLSVLPLAARAQSIQWIRQFGTAGSDQAFAAAADSTGVYVATSVSGGLAGQTYVGAGDAAVRKYDPNGNIVWTREFGTPARDAAFAVAVNSTGVYVVGTTDGALPGQFNAGSTDSFLRKYDLNGNELWTRQFGTAGLESTVALAVDATGVYVLSSTDGAFPGFANLGSRDVYIHKYDLNGNELGAVQAGTSASDSVSGGVADGTVGYISGSTGGTLPGQSSAGGTDAYVRKYDTIGNELWTRQYGTSGSDAASDVDMDGSGIYVVGSTQGTLSGQTSAGTDDAYVRKYDHNGNELWTRQFGTAASDFGAEISVNSDGVFAFGRTAGSLAGQTSAGGQDAYVRKYDFDGNAQWTVQFGTSGDDDVGGGGIAAFGTSAFAVGDTASGLALPGQTSLGSFDAFLVRVGPNLAPPSVSDGGVVNNASFAVHPAPMAPGSIAAVFGSNLNEGSPVLFSSLGPDGKLVTTLGGASVRVNNIPAPMFYATSGQLGIQIPFELAGQTSATVQATVGGQTSAARTIFLDSFAPGLFTVNQSGTGLAAALHQDGITPVTIANPAHRNEVVVLFATGLGALNPPLATGALSIGNGTVTAPTVTVDNVSATVDFSGAAPGFAGLYQVNVRIPASTRQLNTIPVVLSIGGKTSNSVTIPVVP